MLVLTFSIFRDSKMSHWKLWAHAHVRLTGCIVADSVIRGIEVNCATKFVLLLERLSIEVETCFLLLLLLNELAESPALLFANNQEQEKHP